MPQKAGTEQPRLSIYQMAVLREMYSSRCSYPLCNNAMLFYEVSHCIARTVMLFWNIMRPLVLYINFQNGIRYAKGKEGTWHDWGSVSNAAAKDNRCTAITNELFRAEQTEILILSSFPSNLLIHAHSTGRFKSSLVEMKSNFAPDKPEARHLSLLEVNSLISRTLQNSVRSWLFTQRSHKWNCTGGMKRSNLLLHKS